MSRSIPRPSPALVVACLALAVALSGTSYADVLNVPTNSVGTAHLKANAVVSSKVRNRSLLAVDFKPGQLPAGAKGDKGDAGAPGISGYELVTGRSDAPNHNFNSLVVSCPAGKRALGGGGGTAGGVVLGDGPYLQGSRPVADGTGWAIETVRTTSGPSALLGFTICANVS